MAGANRTTVSETEALAQTPCSCHNPTYLREWSWAILRTLRVVAADECNQKAIRLFHDRFAGRRIRGG